MNYSEVCFLKAEAALRGWQGAGDAQTNYEKRYPCLIRRNES